MDLEILESVPSTMDAAREALLDGRVRFDSDGIASPGGVLARDQRAGRGQRGRVWFAAPGESLSATYYVHCVDGPASAGRLAFVAGVAVAEAIEPGVLAAHREPRQRLGIKWPNDIMIGSKKVGGILIEVLAIPDRWVALVGVGVNVHSANLPPGLAVRATSLALEGVIGSDVDAMAQRIGAALLRWAEVAQAGGFSAVLDRWKEYDITRGRLFEAEADGATFVGVADGVDDGGGLRIRRGDGKIVVVRSATTLIES